MAEGEAIKGHYEVRDLETGEVLDEPYYVLRPRIDGVARTAMFAYAAACGVGRLAGDEEKDDVGQFIAMPPDTSADRHREMLNHLEMMLDIPESAADTESGVDLENLATLGEGSDGSMEYAIRLLESIGYELVNTILRRIPEERQQEAKEWILERRKKAQDAYLEEQKASTLG